MSLADLIRYGPSATANANPAKAANDGVVSGQPLAKLAPLALANPPEATRHLSVTAQNDDPATEARQQRAASAAAAIVRRETTGAEEREILNWLGRIGEFDPVVIGETLAKCRTNPTYRAAFLKMARDDDGTVH